jgi:hypothetical protein
MTQQIHSIVILPLLLLVLLPVHTFAINDTELPNESLTRQEQKLVQDIEKADPQKPKKQKLKFKKNKIKNSESYSEGEFSTNLKNFTLTNNGKQTVVGSPSEIDQIDPKINNGKIIYKSSDDTVDLTMESVEGGVRQVLHINNAEQPNRYKFPMDLPIGSKFVKNKDESVNVVDQNNKTTLYILTPWAVDANGKKLQTYYEVEDSQIIQYINFENAQFPITADPTWCGRIWNSLYWQDRANEGGYSLIVSPNWCGRQLTSNSWNAWDEFKDIARNAPFDWQWTWADRDFNNPNSKFWSMWKQFYCHADIAFWKNTWNLEPWRPDRRWREIYNSKQPNGEIIPCNPN